MGEKAPQTVDHNKELAARLMAVQAYYQISQNNKPLRLVMQEYIDRGGVQLDFDEEEKVKPHGGLFKRILCNIDERMAEIDEILKAHIHTKDMPPAAQTPTDDNDSQDRIEREVPKPKKGMEPLLHAVLTCAICELLIHQDIDAPLIIDDYLHVTHAFYEKNQVGFVNGILDNIAKIVRAT